MVAWLLSLNASYIVGVLSNDCDLAYSGALQADAIVLVRMMTQPVQVACWSFISPPLLHRPPPPLPPLHPHPLPIPFVCLPPQLLHSVPPRSSPVQSYASWNIRQFAKALTSTRRLHVMQVSA
jgi:hypothetical protein